MSCVACKHKSVMALEPADVVKESNVAIAESYNAKFARWNSQPESSRGGKLRRVGLQSHLLAVTFCR